MANMDRDSHDKNVRSLRSRNKNARPRYTNDLPAETVQALARLSHDGTDDESLAPTRKKACKKSVDYISKDNKKVISMACDTKHQPPKTSGPEPPSPRSPVNEIDDIKAKIATQHTYSKVLSEERRKLWGEMESYEARIRDHQHNISENNEAVDVINNRFTVCEWLEKKISECCDRLWTIAGDLDASAVVVGQLLGELVEKSHA